MEGKFNELELEWIKETLYVHGDYIIDLLQEEIERKRLIKKEELLPSLGYKVTTDGNNPKLQISFESHGRFIEIRWHRSKNTSKFFDANRNNDQLKRKPKRKYKDTRWYAKNVYGSLNRLIGMLMYEFTDRERERIKGILEARQQSTTI